MVAEVKRKQEKKEKKKKKREKRQLEALAAAAEVENSVLETEVKAGGCGAVRGSALSCCVLGWQSNGSRLFPAWPSRSRAGFVGRCLGSSPPRGEGRQDLGQPPSSPGRARLPLTPGFPLRRTT